jgi:hypothetical protein
MAYVYRHIRLDKNEPFYIGIGSDSNGKYARSKEHRKRNEIWNKIVYKTEYRVEILIDDLTWEETCEKEKEFIELYGRKDLGTGCLVNMTNGGEGNYGRVLSNETKLKISNSNKGKIIPKEIIEKIRLKLIGKVHSDETKEKMSLSHKGKPHIISKEGLERIAKKRRGVINWYSIEQARKANIGKKHTKETIEKRIKNRTKIKHTEESIQKMRDVAILNGRGKSILCLNNNIVYNSIAGAERELNINNIQKVLKGQIINTKGYKFIYQEIRELKAKLN